jgi:hypothetical protein
MSSAQNRLSRQIGNNSASVRWQDLSRERPLDRRWSGSVKAVSLSHREGGANSASRVTDGPLFHVTAELHLLSLGNFAWFWLV